MADKPVTREEKYLAYLTGDYTGEIPKPITRKEKYLYELCLKGIGGEISPEEIKAAVNEYLEKNPVKPGATTEQAQQIEQNKTDVASLKEETGSLKEDLSNKITKFYASNQGETHITDSDNGKIQDMMIYGKSSQDGTPTPENPVEIKSVVNPTVKVCGKNLLNPLSMKKGQISTDDGKTINEQENYYHSDYIPMIGTSLSLFYGSYVRWFLYDKNKNFISSNSINAIGGKTVTISECNYIRIHMSIIKVPDNLMIAYGTDASFEPYRGQTVTLPYTLNAIPVSSGGNVTINGHQYIADYVDVERGKLVRMCKEVEYNGDESWELQSVNANNIVNFKLNGVMALENKGLSNKLLLQNTLIANTDSEGFYINNIFQLFIRISKNRNISTVAEFKNFLSKKSYSCIISIHHTRRNRPHTRRNRRIQSTCHILPSNQHQRQFRTA